MIDDRPTREEVRRLMRDNLRLKERWCAANRVLRRLEKTIARVETLCTEADKDCDARVDVDLIRGALRRKAAEDELEQERD